MNFQKTSRRLIKRGVFALLALFLVTLACGVPAATPTSPKPANTPTPTVNPAALWYLRRGDAKSDQFWGIDTDSQGNLYAAGYFQSPASEPFFDMVIYKFDPNGNELWRTQWGDPFEQKAFIVVVDEPYVYVGGTSRPSISLTEADMALVCLDMQTGEVIWNFSWGQGFGYEELDGLVVEKEAIYLSGWTTGESTSNDIAVLKLDRSGKLVWVQTWGSAGFDTADGQMVVDENAIYVSGRYEGANILLGGRLVLVKFDKTTGIYQKHALWGSAIGSDGLGSSSDGTYIYVVGLNVANANGQIALLKFDKNLNLIWAREWGGKAGESARVAEVDDGGNILVAGSTYSYGAGGSDIVLLQYDPNGRLDWYQTWGGQLNDVVHGMALDGDFVYLVGSTENDSLGMNDALIIKADRHTGRLPAP